MRTTFAAAVSAAAAISLATACDNGPSAVAQQQAAGGGMASAGTAGQAAAMADHRRDPVKLTADGAPTWSASRRYSAEEGAERNFRRNGADFGAGSVDDFVRRAHAFLKSPPEGVETIRRANGDTLYYDARANVFAVADRAGAPRTMFKPRDGAAYWQEQKTREARRAAARSARADDEA